jgi:FtsH-binding integral membrane protein
MQAILLSTCVFFALTGLLWYLRPDPNLWLLGSLFLTCVWGVLFMRLITKEQPK